MRTRYRTGECRARGRGALALRDRLGAASLIMLGLLAGASSSSGARPLQAARDGSSAHAHAARARASARRRSAPLQRASIVCHGTTYGHTPYVECVLPSSGHIHFPGDVPVLAGNLSSDTPVTITAVGGQGGFTSADCCRSPGRRGEARTVVDYGALAHSGVYAYLGESGGPCCGHDRFHGGTATIALSTPLHHGVTLRDVYLIAGGSGAQGRFYTDYISGCGAGGGGNAHRADAFDSLVPVSAPGGRGGQGSRTPPFCTKGGTPGEGGGDGVGGVQPEDSRLDGTDGIGGHGGGSSWIGAQGGVPGSWTPGHGGAGSDAQGGGGWGGGAAGTRGSGAGAGGSYAAAATANAPAATGYRSQSSVTIAWPQPKIELHASGRNGGHGTIDYYLDGKLQETISGRRTIHVPAGYVVAVSDPRFVPNVGPVIVALPASGSRSIGWSGAATGTEPQVITINRTGMTFSAGFVPANAIAAADGPGRITVRRPDGSVLCHEVRVCEAPHQQGEQVQLTATPDPIADFAHFIGPCDTIEVNHCTGRIASNELFIAAFNVPEVTLTMRVNPYGTLGTLQIGGQHVCGFSIGQWQNCTVRVPARGPLVHVHAGSAGIIPAEFDRWTGACTGAMLTCTIDPARGAQTLTATYR